MPCGALLPFTYDATGRLASVTTGASEASPTTRYAHNALGQRVFKTEPIYPSADSDKANDTSLAAFFARLWNWATTSNSASTTDADRLGHAFVYDEQGTLMGEYGAGGAKSAGSRQYIWLPTPMGPMPVATVQNQTTVQAITADHLNTPRQLTSADGTLLWQWPFSAFGDEPPHVADKHFAMVPAAEGDFEFNLRYPGQYFDKESGLHYNGFRTYDPKTGRYTQPDPIGLAGGWNRFNYVGGNPLAAIDPYGLWSFTFGGYAGPGFQITAGNDNGNGFLTVRVGMGAGGGLSLNPNGGMPGGQPKDPMQGGVVLACSAKASFNAGPIQASLEGGGARNYNDENSTPTTSASGSGRFSNGWLGGSAFWGVNANANVGAQITIYGGR